MKRTSIAGISLLITILMVGSAFSLKNVERRNGCDRLQNKPIGHWVEKLDLTLEQQEQVKVYRIANRY